MSIEKAPLDRPLKPAYPVFFIDPIGVNRA